jgi:light-regulated signal transduction histidine kinase (bacteriophytochrome)
MDEQGEGYLDSALEGCGRMRQLIEGLLSYSRVDKGEEEPQLVSVEETLTRVLEGLKGSIDETRAVVTHDPLPEVHANATQVGQLFQNLLSNAIKFRGKRDPRIHLSAEAREGEWVFSFRDNGVGFDMAHAEKIFEVFKRLHRNSEYAGSGIGLAVCRRIVERHGGKIWVADSKPGEGTTICFSLPEAVPAARLRQA